MTKKPELIARLQAELREVKAHRQAALSDPALQGARTAVKRFQSMRLARTHADLLGAPATAPAARFFLDELYGERDLSQRDRDLERIIPTLQKLLPHEPLHAVTEAIVLDALSERLDTAMARALGATFTAAHYVAAYRTVTTLAERQRQLDLVDALGDSLCSIVRIPMLAVTLRLMAGPASAAGLGQLHAFLHDGFTTFKGLREPARFVATIVGRERAILAAIFAGAADPFKAAQRSA
jgi:hypothetical protein